MALVKKDFVKFTIFTATCLEISVFVTNVGPLDKSHIKVFDNAQASISKLSMEENQHKVDWHISSKEAFTHYLNASYPVSLLSTANIVTKSEKSFCARILIVLGSMSSLSDQGFSEPASKNKIHWTIHVF